MSEPVATSRVDTTRTTEAQLELSNAGDSRKASTVLELSFETLRRGRRCVLAGHTLRIPVGATVALIGANGAGKSSLLLAVAGALGQVESRSTPAGAHERAGAGEREGETSIGYVPQRPAFPEWLRVGELPALHAISLERWHSLAAALGVNELRTRRANALSGGEAQAVALALALAGDHALLLLDEPLTGLDPGRRRAAIDLMVDRRRHQARGVTIISSHVAAELHELCDWVIVLARQRVVFEGSAEQLMASHAAGGQQSALERFERAVVRAMRDESADAG
jgi:ABC-type multidrug transport system ATPase subunit